MKIAQINMFSTGSTGKIMMQIAENARDNGHTVYTYSPYACMKKYQKMPTAPEGHMYYGTYLGRRIHNLVGRIIGCNGCLSIHGTMELVRQLKKNEIDLIHLHNLHSYCINFPILFRYIEKNNIKVVWTLHDCWTFTGHCPHFEYVQCDKWKKECERCVQYREYPQSLIDNSRYMFRLKKRWFTRIDNLTLVTPSEWLSTYVKQSYLQKYDVKVIRNGIDLNVFKPCNGQVLQKYDFKGKYVVLGVAYFWDNKKGLDVFIELAKRLEEKCQIILVGTDQNVDLKLPSNIISIHRTQNAAELAELYTAADVFVNPTREDNYPTVNMEAIACGTPVITFRTGGSPETINEKTGVVVEKDDIDELERQILKVVEKKNTYYKSCIKFAKEFEQKGKYQEYVRLYEEIMRQES